MLVPTPESATFTSLRGMTRWRIGAPQAWLKPAGPFMALAAGDAGLSFLRLPAGMT
ncbi:MAG TPA: hypothetical protein VJ577_15645 [Burkholderiaceae bacterium]|nr:hypothetical protein [Burkholderiaceae bacterium]